MALSNQAVTAVLAEVSASGLAATIKQLQDAYVASAITAKQQALAGALSFSVSDWDAVEAALTPNVSATAVYPLRDAIQAKIDARDASGLGALLLAFFSSGKAHLG